MGGRGAPLKGEDGNEVQMGRRVAILSCAAGALLAAVAAAAAQVPELRFARQFSMSYLQFNLMEREHLVEKHAKAAGIAEVKVVWATFNSSAAMNDALLSGSVDIVSGGVPGLLTIWSRTQGTANAAKGIAAFTSQPILLNSRNPNIRGIADFTDQDKIALPQGFDPGHHSANGGGQGVGPGQLRQARPNHGWHVATGCNGGPAQRIG